MLNNTSHAGKETENKYVFKREQKTGRVVADVTSVGRLFHIYVPHYIYRDKWYLCDIMQQTPGVRVLAWNRSLSFEGDSNFRPYLSHLDFCVILLQSI